MEYSLHYPRIVSLSTVGILKHYNQDYLIHPIRTDFVGNNGVGKSIIADLFQLLFITDRSLIKFGTEGLNNDLRKIETIPFNTSEAYVFLNIEVTDGCYITIGTCIPSKSTALKQFIVLRDHDHDKKTEDLTYDKALFLTHKDFINQDQTIFSSQELSKNLRANKGLFLKFFSYKEEKQEYYSWLFNRQILPINLSIEENLKAFAKVIQSFSKAKTLNIDKSDSLKSFLFDDAEKANMIMFEQLKDDLNKLLIDYQNLSNDIIGIEEKQKALEKLKEYENDRNITNINYHRSELIHLYHNWDNQKQEYHKSAKQVEKHNIDLDSVTNRLEEVSPALARLDYDYNSTDQNLINVLKFQTAYQSFQSIDKDLQNILSLKIPQHEAKVIKNLGQIEGNTLELNSFSLQDLTADIEKCKSSKDESDRIVTAINKSIPYYERYVSISQIREKYEEQQLAYDIHKIRLEQEVKNNEAIVEALDFTKEGTLFNWALRQKKELDIAQETLLFHFMHVFLNKPDITSDKTIYTEDPKALLFDSYTEDISNNGIWFNYGNMIEFIPYKEGFRLFEGANSIESTLVSKKDDLLKKKDFLLNQLKELNKVKKGETYNKDLIPFYLFDESLFDYSIVAELERAEQYVLNKEHYIEANNKINKEHQYKIGNYSLMKNKRDTSLADNAKLTLENAELENEIQKYKDEASRVNIEIKKIETDLIALKVQITIDVKEDKLFELVETLEKNKEEYNNERNKIANEKNELEIKKNSLITFINGINERIKVISEILLQCENDYTHKLSIFRNSFSEEAFLAELEAAITHEELEDLRMLKENAQSKYKLFYEDISNKFQETRDGGNELVNEQIQSENFSFVIIEQVLLGGKIGHMDKITPYLAEANEQRINIASTIYETMLRIFNATKDQYENYEVLVKNLNAFFTGKKISNAYFFNINFTPKTKFNIGWIDSLHQKTKSINKADEIFYNRNNDIESFVIDFFKNEVKGVKVTSISELLNPKNYFDLTVSLTDENKKPIPGSTGETYSAITLLGIGRLSIVQNADRNGIRFVILEESASLDNTNFDTFPGIAAEFNYQLITMTPKPYGADSDYGWYLHHLIKGNKNKNINYPVPASYFKTNITSADLHVYLAAKNR